MTSHFSATTVLLLLACAPAYALPVPCTMKKEDLQALAAKQACPEPEHCAACGASVGCRPTAGGCEMKPLVAVALAGDAATNVGYLAFLPMVVDGAQYMGGGDAWHAVRNFDGALTELTGASWETVGVGGLDQPFSFLGDSIPGAARCMSAVARIATQVMEKVEQRKGDAEQLISEEALKTAQEGVDEEEHRPGGPQADECEEGSVCHRASKVQTYADVLEQRERLWNHVQDVVGGHKPLGPLFMDDDFFRLRLDAQSFDVDGRRGVVEALRETGQRGARDLAGDAAAAAGARAGAFASRLGSMLGGGGLEAPDPGLRGAGACAGETGSALIVCEEDARVTDPEQQLLGAIRGIMAYDEMLAGQLATFELQQREGRKLRYKNGRSAAEVETSCGRVDDPTSGFNWLQRYKVCRRKSHTSEAGKAALAKRRLSESTLGRAQLRAERLKDAAQAVATPGNLSRLQACLQLVKYAALGPVGVWGGCDLLHRMNDFASSVRETPTARGKILEMGRESREILLMRREALSESYDADAGGATAEKLGNIALSAAGALGGKKTKAGVAAVRVAQAANSEGIRPLGARPARPA